MAVTLATNTTEAVTLTAATAEQVHTPGKCPDEIIVSTALTDLSFGFGATAPGVYHPVAGTASLTPPPSGHLWLYSSGGGAVQLTAVVAGSRP